jgi:(4S)-4-hydroxy-5-phosphonooxypentane-2,3-dione isomerase
MYVVLVNLVVKTEQLSKFEKAILKNATASARDEKGCKRFDVCQSESNPAEWILYEVYTDRAAFDEHHQSPHFLEWNQVAQEVVASKKLTTFIQKS